MRVATRAADVRRKHAEAKKEERAARDELVRAEKALAEAVREEDQATRARERAEQAVESIQKRLERLRGRDEDEPEVLDFGLGAARMKTRSVLRATTPSESVASNVTRQEPARVG